MVITGLTRNQFESNLTRVRIPPSAPKTLENVVFSRVFSFVLVMNDSFLTHQKLILKLEPHMRNPLRHKEFQAFQLSNYVKSIRISPNSKNFIIRS